MASPNPYRSVLALANVYEAIVLDKSRRGDVAFAVLLRPPLVVNAVPMAARTAGMVDTIDLKHVRQPWLCLQLSPFSRCSSKWRLGVHLISHFGVDVGPSIETSRAFFLLAPDSHITQRITRIRLPTEFCR
jgi:hypothetical protein